MNSTNSAFKMPLAPMPHPPSEALLFNDILEEKTQALRNTMNEFLQVQPYRKFEIEFSNFLKRTRQIMLEGQRNGENISRLANSSHISAMYSRPSSSFNYRPSTTMSTVNSNRNSTFRLPENNFQTMTQLNPFKPPMDIQPIVVLPRIEQSLYTSHRSPSCTTVVEVNQLNNETDKKNNNRELSQYSKLTKPSEKSQSNIPNSYSDITMIDNNLDVCSQHDENVDDNNDIESLMESIGFKIVVGLPSNTKKNNTQLPEKTVQNDEKFLSKWSLNMKKINSFNCVLLTGTLLEQDQITVKEIKHNAGILLARKAKNLVKTKNGFYHLLGNIIGGSPNEVYQTCFAINGIPRTWKNDFKLLNTDVKNNKNVLLNFSLDSPAGPIKPKSVNLDISMTRNGKMYSKNMKTVNQKTHGKRKSSENDSPKHDTINQRKHRKFYDQSSPLLASTPKRPRIRTNVLTPTQILKNKICQNINIQAKTKSNSRSLNNANDSIAIIKKRPSYSKEQANILAEATKLTKEMSSSKNNNTSEKNSELVMERIIASRVNDFKKSKQTSIINNSSNYSSVKQSKSKSSGSSSAIFNSNSTAYQSNLKTSVNSTKNSASVNSTKNNTSVNSSKNNGMNSTRSKQMSPVKCTKALGQKESINSVQSSEVLNKNKTTKTIKEKTKNGAKKLNNINVQKEKMPMLSNSGSLPEMGIFGDVDFAAYGVNEEYNVIISPSKMSIMSHTGKSRSVTPPILSNLCGESGKSILISEPPTPLSKSVEAKALKRVKQPKITIDDELKNMKRLNKKQVDYKTATKKLNKIIEYGTEFNNSDDE